MNVLRMLTASVFVCVLALGASAADKADNAKMLVGTWKVTKADPDSLKEGTMVEMTKDGKLTVKEKDEKMEGTYTVDGDKLKISLTVKEQKMEFEVTIKKISDTELTTEHDGKTVHFEKQKTK